MSRLERLRALEVRYNGPIPNTERDTALYGVPRARRNAGYRVRIHRQEVAQAITASARWRESAHRYLSLKPLQRQRRRLALTCTMVYATQQFLAWRIFEAAPLAL